MYRTVPYSVRQSDEIERMKGHPSFSSDNYVLYVYSLSSPTFDQRDNPTYIILSYYILFKKNNISLSDNNNTKIGFAPIHV